MKSVVHKVIGALALGSASLLGGTDAQAASPPSIAGNWSAVGNQAIGVLTIFQPFSLAVCKPISGFIFGSPIQGFDCPATGRIVFARTTAAGLPFQFYQGAVGRDAVVDRIGGTFSIWNGLGGGAANEGVDYNFSATK